MNSIQKFAFGGTEIDFDIQESIIMINATEMSKPFGKLAKDFIDTDQTQAFINELSQKENIPFQEILKIVKGGKNSGTWMHRKLALKFAGWLSPAFELWVYDVIEQILFGNTKIVRSNHESLKVITDRIKEIDQTASVIMKERWQLNLQKEELEARNLAALGISKN